MYLHGNSPTRLRIERRLEANVRDADLGEEVVDHPYQVAQIQVPIGHEQLHLVELSQVSCVHRLVSEHAVNREAFEGSESLRILRHFVQLLRAHRGGVGPQDVLHRLLSAPVISIAERPKPSFRVDLRHVLQVVLRHRSGGGRVADEEGVLRIASRMALRLEQRVEVPERRLHELVRRHLGEPHFEKDLAELGSNHQQRMQIPRLWLFPQRTEVITSYNEVHDDTV